MSSSDGFLTSLQSIQKNLFRIGGPILLVFGVVSCVVNLIIFTQKNLRKSPCSIYLIAVNIANFLYITLSTLFLILSVGYSIDLTTYNVFMCRFYYYRSYLFDILSAFYLILASIDRVLVTSSNARTRQKSTRHLAHICIGCGTLFWMLFHCHALILMDIQEIAPGYFICYFRAGLYVVFTGYYSLLVKAITVPLLMIIFGIWTTRNIRKVRQRRIAPVIMNPAFANPEDIEPEKRKTIQATTSDSDVERVRRNHLNDIENIIPFVLTGFCYIACNPNATLALWHFRIFFFSRLFHTFAYQIPIRQPSRALAFLVGFVVTVSMAAQILFQVY
ncbi:unnamed protein product [Adineta steineri]|uniref:Microsomal glutathione S-transferase 1 n=2 Tax=Adineta steineri TaxID=433720 RepID=A0A813X1B0_9BILA|nr:unnamed protein product [Adineta steineri]